MRRLMCFLFVAVLFVNEPLAFGKTGKSETEIVKVVEDVQNAFQWGDLYLSGQPNLEQLRYFKDLGVTKVINLRSEKENEQFSKTAFSEESMLESMGIEYTSIPVGGREAYTTENLTRFINEINKTDGKVLIHCKGCGRVTYFFMAYLISEKQYSMDEALKVGEQLTYFSPLKSLLNDE